MESYEFIKSIGEGGRRKRTLIASFKRRPEFMSSRDTFELIDLRDKFRGVRWDGEKYAGKNSIRYYERTPWWLTIQRAQDSWINDSTFIEFFDNFTDFVGKE